MNKILVMIEKVIKESFSFHDKDKVALTSRGYFWSAFEDEMTSKSICVMPPSSRNLPKNIAGVCSDYIGYYK